MVFNNLIARNMRAISLTDVSNEYNTLEWLIFLRVGLLDLQKKEALQGTVCIIDLENQEQNAPRSSKMTMNRRLCFSGSVPWKICRRLWASCRVGRIRCPISGHAKVGLIEPVRHERCKDLLHLSCYPGNHVDPRILKHLMQNMAYATTNQVRHSDPLDHGHTLREGEVPEEQFIPFCLTSVRDGYKHGFGAGVKDRCYSR